jgi:hypothetical protein
MKLVGPDYCTAVEQIYYTNNLEIKYQFTRNIILLRSYHTCCPSEAEKNVHLSSFSTYIAMAKQLLI